MLEAPPPAGGAAAIENVGWLDGEVSLTALGGRQAANRQVDVMTLHSNISRMTFHD
jgi:hypothetical protein